jgi:hypothetical protein
MSRFLRWSVRAYHSLLILYPDDLRRDFGPEMLEAFMQDLSVECAARSVKGAIRVWRITLRELIQIGFPAWLETPAVTVPAISSAMAIVWQSPLLIMISRRAHLSLHFGDDATRYALAEIAVSAVVTALTSFVAVCRWKRASLISLGIGQFGIG